MSKISLTSGLAISALAALTLAGCGPDAGGANPSASASAASGSSAASAAASTMAVNTPPPAAPACPKLAAPRCPATAPVALKPAPSHIAAVWSRKASGHEGRGWGRRHCVHRHAHHGWADRRVDREQHYGYIGGPPVDLRVERREQVVRSDSRTVEVYRESRGGVRPCPSDCRGFRRLDGYRTFGYAGIDERGYLVWPGKVEY